MSTSTSTSSSASASASATIAAPAVEPRPLDIAAAQALGMAMIGRPTAAGMGALTVIGDRLGLFDVLAQHGPLTGDPVADAAGIHPRHARERLSAMACRRYVTRGAAAGTHSGA